MSTLCRTPYKRWSSVILRASNQYMFIVFIESPRRTGDLMTYYIVEFVWTEIQTYKVDSTMSNPSEYKLNKKSKNCPLVQ